MLQSRGSDRFKLAEFLPAERALERLMEVLGLEPQADDEILYWGCDTVCVCVCDVFVYMYVYIYIYTNTHKQYIGIYTYAKYT